MEKHFVKYKGRKYPVRLVPISEDYGYGNPVQVTDIELWFAIEEDYGKGLTAAREIDNKIFYYCHSGFIASDPTDGKIIEYLIGRAI